MQVLDRFQHGYFFFFHSSTGLLECRSFRHSDIYKFHAAQLIRRDRENYLTYNIIVVLKEFNYLLAVLKIQYKYIQLLPLHPRLNLHQSQESPTTNKQVMTYKVNIEPALKGK
jgi:hypothetical protein